MSVPRLVNVYDVGMATGTDKLVVFWGMCLIGLVTLASLPVVYLAVLMRRLWLNL